MAVRRTKKQKQATQIKRENSISYKFEDVAVDQPKKQTSIDLKQIKKLMVSTPAQVMRDLLKTVVVTIFVLAVLFVIYFVTEVK